MSKSVVAKKFASALDTYNRSAVIQRKIAAQIIQLMRKNGFPEKSTIYEVGAGTGILTKMILDEFDPLKIAANDLCIEAEELLSAISDKIEFLHGDAETISVPSYCSHVVSSSTVQWFSDLDQFIKVIAEGLGRDSYFVFSTFGPENLYEIRKITGLGLNYHSLAEHKMLLEKSGFAILHASETTEKTTHTSMTDLLRHIRETGVGGIGKTTPGAAATRRFCRKYEEQFATQDGIVLTYHPMFFVCKLK